MMWATIGFFGFMWMGEFMVWSPDQVGQVLAVDDVTVDSQGWSTYACDHPKTNPYGEGVTICLTLTCARCMAVLVGPTWQ